MKCGLFTSSTTRTAGKILSWTLEMVMVDQVRGHNVLKKAKFKMKKWWGGLNLVGSRMPHQTLTCKLIMSSELIHIIMFKVEMAWLDLHVVIIIWNCLFIKKNLEGKYQIKKTLIIVIEKIRNLSLRENAKWNNVHFLLIASREYKIIRVLDEQKE